MGKSKFVYLTGLNGIRALVSIAVVVAHVTNHLSDFGIHFSIFGYQNNGSPKSWELAQYGVTIFFVLSGFLITYLLLLEKDKQDIDIKKFYYRRALRIWPLYYSYLFLVIIFYLIFQIEINNNTLFFYVFMGGNIPLLLNNSLPMLGHYWSLGAEEQYYLVWPLFSKYMKNILKGSVFIVVIVVSIKLLLHILVPNSLLEMYIHYSKFDCMTIGAVFAILYKEKSSIFLQITTNTYIQLLAWVCLIFVALNKFHIISVLDHEIIAVVSAVIIIGQITSTGLINLENKVLNYLGKISFGIYIIHPIIIFIFAKLFHLSFESEILSYIIILIMVLGVTIIFSQLSYKYLESYFLSIKRNKYTTIKSSNVKK